MGQIKITNEDNMELMARYPDNHFELAIVDPPYGISQPVFRKGSKNKVAKTKEYNNEVYNQNAPDEKYFSELFRISKNQIIWGANYYNNLLSPGNKWIFWDKGTEKTQWGDGELAYTSFSGSITKYSFTWNGMIQGDMKNKEIRIHPTQKPVKLYEWLLMNYAKEGDKILDTHLGSGSIAIACHNLGFDLTACELDKDYYEAAIKRLKQHQSQLTMF